MSDRFEEAIKTFYEKESISTTKLIEFSEESSISRKDIANNLNFCIKHIVLLGKVSLKNFHKILEKQKEIEERVKRCEEQQQKNQRELKRTLSQIETHLSTNKPLTKPEILALVQEIAQQPKLIEEKALKLTSQLDAKLEKVEKLIQHLVNWTS